MDQLIPSHEIAEKLSTVLSYVRTDYAAQANKQDSFLYKMFEDGALFSKKYFDELVASLMTKASDPKHIAVKMGWDIDTAQLHGIKVYMDLENRGKENFIGSGQGRYAPEIGATTYRESFTQGFQSTCGILIHSQNSVECELLYEFVKLALIVLIPKFEAISCMKNISIGGNSITYDGRIPEGIYSKVVTMSFDYEQIVPDLLAKQLLTGIFTTLTISEE